MHLLRLVAALLTCIIASTPGAVLADSAPQFADYPATETWDGKPVDPKMNNDFARNYKTRLSEIALGPANFAGHIALGSWGCGSGGCLMGGVVDLHSGKVTDFPQTTIQSDGSESLPDAGLRYDVSSRLIIFRGVANESGPPSANYYTYEDGSFQLIYSEPLPIPNTAQEEPYQTFMGYSCSIDCSGHEAGYSWAEKIGITNPGACSGKSQSFIEGCMAYVSEHTD